MERIEERAQDVDRLFNRFRQQQVEFGGEVTAADKKHLRDRVKELEDELNGYLAGEYGIKSNDAKRRAQWVNSHKPFNWFIEFHSSMTDGGFDVVIGNPPYVETNKVRDYKTLKYATGECGNLYPLFVERSAQILARSGRFGMIVPLSGFSTARMEPYQNFLWSWYDQMHLSFYSGDAHPSILFSGVKYRLAIILAGRRGDSGQKAFVTSYMRWYADARDSLFSTLSYVACFFESGFLRFAKLDGIRSIRVLERMLEQRSGPGHYLRPTGTVHLTYHRSPVFWIRSMDFEPYFRSTTRSRSEDHLKDLYVTSQSELKRIGAVINSTCFYFWFTTQGNCRNITAGDVENVPIGKLAAKDLAPVESVFGRLMENLQKNSRRRIYNYEVSGRVEYDEFYPNKSKHIIDEIDRVLAQHYGFTEEELDFIINYDIKYRMGLTVEQEDEE